jgi:UDP-N-acetylglucosamine--N-acetylmuramyl-(pentapeptide) pyrophosphoryl-undecaprenol N-acetylglucosamine transferase
MSTKKNKKMIIMAGGTGGHIYPGLAVAEALANKGVSVEWLGTKAGLEATLVPRHAIPFHAISVAGLRGRGRLNYFFAPFTLLKALVQTIRIFKKVKPEVVLGMGGFASGPGGVAAWLMRIPVLIHEQNAIPGLTNKLLARLSRRVMMGFSGAFSGKKTVYTGNPLRADFCEISPHKKTITHPLKILVIGGSRGAAFLNQLLPNCMGSFAKELRLEVWHQTGEKDAREVKSAYEKQSFSAKVMPYVEDMKAAFQWADLVVCRAGAMTVAEVSAAGCPALFVPYPHAVDDHQTKNAKALVDKKAALLLPQSQLTPERLKEVITGFYHDLDSLLAMSMAMFQTAKVDATLLVANECMEVMSV